ncbi:ThiF family adenylyltransferase [Mycolicibacterium sp. Dal123E01]|uniref:ThiF family adenylyltransferase n=1 Tax=Mycolicibacterium sp. Dal123E01 TaxID=3457578 RepID=UPI00403E7BAC
MTNHLSHDGATVTMTDEIYGELLSMATEPLECAAVLLGHLVDTSERSARVVVTAVRRVPDDAYRVRGERELEITSEGYMPALAEVNATSALAIWVHTHPGDGAVVLPSRHDDVVNAELHDVFALRSHPECYAWMVLGRTHGRLTFTGALETNPTDKVRFTRLNVVGTRFLRISAQDDADTEALPELFDRNIRALGFGVQKVISDLTVAVVGVGGTGSAVAEQLVRLGVRRLLVVDPDTLSLSNVTRVYGSTPQDVDQPKVEVIARHLTRIAPDLLVRPIQGTITTERVARELLGADVVFGCTDDNAGRLRLSRLPYYYGIPVIDCGVLLNSDADDVIDGVFGRVTTIHPGGACLVCRGRVDLAMADAELRPPEEQQRLEREDYAPALPGVEPALVTFTTMTASWAVSELLERLIGYGEQPAPSELLLRVHDRKVSVNSDHPADGHYCHHDTKLTYDEDMFLGMNWPT